MGKEPKHGFKMFCSRRHRKVSLSPKNLAKHFEEFGDGLDFFEDQQKFRKVWQNLRKVCLYLKGFGKFSHFEH